jgi:hypothetical protein
MVEGVGAGYVDVDSHCPERQRASWVVVVSDVSCLLFLSSIDLPSLPAQSVGWMQFDMRYIEEAFRSFRFRVFLFPPCLLRSVLLIDLFLLVHAELAGAHVDQEQKTAAAMC